MRRGYCSRRPNELYECPPNLFWFHPSITVLWSVLWVTRINVKTTRTQRRSSQTHERAAFSHAFYLTDLCVFDLNFVEKYRANIIFLKKKSLYCVAFHVAVWIVFQKRMRNKLIYFRIVCKSAEWEKWEPVWNRSSVLGSVETVTEMSEILLIFSVRTTAMHMSTEYFGTGSDFVFNGEQTPRYSS